MEETKELFVEPRGTTNQAIFRDLAEDSSEMEECRGQKDVDGFLHDVVKLTRNKFAILVAAALHFAYEFKVFKRNENCRLQPIELLVADGKGGWYTFVSEEEACRELRVSLETLSSSLQVIDLRPAQLAQDATLGIPPGKKRKTPQNIRPTRARRR